MLHVVTVIYCHFIDPRVGSYFSEIPQVMQYRQFYDQVNHNSKQASGKVHLNLFLLERNYHLNLSVDRYM